MRRMLGLGLAAAVLVSVGVALAIIVTPDHDEVPTNVLTADSGVTIDLGVTPATALLTAPAMSPGDVVTGTLSLTNPSTIDVYVDVQTTHSNPGFAGELVMAIQAGSCGVTPGINADGSAQGANISYGPYNSPGVLAIVSVGAGGADSLCLSVGMPSGIEFSTVEGESDDATIILDSDDSP